MLAPIIIKQIVKLAKGTARFDALADDMISKFELGCPPVGELERIISQKQQIVAALSQVSTVINTITKIGTTLDGILTGLNIAVNVIKFLPIPLPPFSPALLATGPAVAVDILGDLVKAGKGAIKIIPGALKQIADGIAALIEKLNTIDGLLNPCLEAAGLDGSINNDDLNNLLNSSGLNSDADANQATEAELLAKLQPNSNDPMFYKGYKLVIQNDPTNQFSFVSRRIMGENDNNEKLYNLKDEGYSFSSSVQVLIDEIKFRIDLLQISNPSLFNILDNNQSGSVGETGTCSIGGYTTREACEAAGGVFTPDNAGAAGQDASTFGTFNAASQGTNRLLGSGTLTPKFGFASAKMIVSTVPAEIRITARTGKFDFDLPLGISLESETIVQFTATNLTNPSAPPIVKQVAAGPSLGGTLVDLDGSGPSTKKGYVNTTTFNITSIGQYSYEFELMEDKFPDSKNQLCGEVKFT